MKLSPLDIRKQEFKRSMRGYDPDEVEAFLTMIADEFELLIREKNQLSDETLKLRTQLKDYQQVESTLRETLVKAQHTIEDSKANSKREAEIIIHEAELRGENIIKEAKDDLLRIRNEVHLIRAQKESFANRLRHLLESQIELLSVLELDDEEMVAQGYRSPRKRQEATQAEQQQRQSQPPIIRDGGKNAPDNQEQTPNDIIV